MSKKVHERLNELTNLWDNNAMSLSDVSDLINLLLDERENTHNEAVRLCQDFIKENADSHIEYDLAETMDQLLK